MINVFQPSLGDAELAAIRDVFESNWIGKGSRVAAFEAAFASHLRSGPENVLSVTSCTEGLFQSVAALGLGKGDDVVMPTVGFVGAANAVFGAGARAVFCDVDPRHLNPDVAHIEAALTPDTRAVMILHYGGVPHALDDIAAFCRERGLHLIEDCACSVASSWNGQPCGTFGDVAVWSFDSMKILVTGDGGMIWARDPDLAARLRNSIMLGLDTESGLSSDSERWWEFSVSNFGRRAIMNDVTGAIGLVQIDRLADFIRRRQEIDAIYRRELAGIDGLRLPPAVPQAAQSSYYLFWVQLEPALRDRLAMQLRSEGIYTTFRYYPLHRVERYGQDVSLPGADEAADGTLCLPLHQSLSDDDVARVIEAVRRFMVTG